MVVILLRIFPRPGTRNVEGYFVLFYIIKGPFLNSLFFPPYTK